LLGLFTSTRDIHQVPPNIHPFHQNSIADAMLASGKQKPAGKMGQV
jgi:hypothetical protein